MGRVDYDDHQYKVFSRARTPLPENRRLWAAIFRNWLGGADTVVDVGAGVGHYSVVLADALPEARVIGIEPSEKMRAVAAAERADERVSYLAGSAEDLPLEDASADGALISNVIHHIDDRPRAAAELHRVLRPGAPVMVRGSLRDSLRDNAHWRFFPGAYEIAAANSPSVAEVVALFTQAGFDDMGREQVVQPTAPDLRTFAERISYRAISTLELLDDDVFEQGLADLRAAAAAETDPQPVLETMDVLMLRRSAG
jgi:ubiquinone/menaquinone biosynthesis C-methylase UbiE